MRIKFSNNYLKVTDIIPANCFGFESVVESFSKDLINKINNNLKGFAETYIRHLATEYEVNIKSNRLDSSSYPTLRKLHNDYSILQYKIFINEIFVEYFEPLSHFGPQVVSLSKVPQVF